MCDTARSQSDNPSAAVPQNNRNNQINPSSSIDNSHITDRQLRQLEEEFQSLDALISAEKELRDASHRTRLQELKIIPYNSFLAGITSNNKLSDVELNKLIDERKKRNIDDNQHSQELIKLQITSEKWTAMQGQSILRHMNHIGFHHTIYI